MKNFSGLIFPLLLLMTGVSYGGVPDNDTNSFRGYIEPSYWNENTGNAVSNWTLYTQNQAFLLTCRGERLDGQGDGVLRIDGNEYMPDAFVDITGKVSTRTYPDGNEYEVLDIIGIGPIDLTVPHIVTQDHRNDIWSIHSRIPLEDGTVFHRTDQYLFGRDTLINGKCYRQVISREKGDRNNSYTTYALREEEARLYAFVYADGREYLIADFSVQKGDIVKMDWMEETVGRKNPVYKVTGNTVLEDQRIITLYDTVYHKTETWTTCTGLNLGIAWNRLWHIPSEIEREVLCINGSYRRFHFDDYYRLCYVASDNEKEVCLKGKLFSVSTPYVRCPSCAENALAISDGEQTYLLTQGYRWMEDGEYLAGECVEVKGVAALLYDLNGERYIELEIGEINKMGCEDASSVELSSHTTSLHMLYPNPARKEITISTSGKPILQVEILDINGRVLHKVGSINTERFTYNVSGFAKGTYLARVKTGSSVETLKFVVK